MAAASVRLAVESLVLLVLVVCAPGAVPPARAPAPRLLVLHGSQTGTAEDIAVGLCRSASQRGLAPRCLPMDAYDISGLPSEALVVCVASTTGDGEAPLTMRRFWATLRRRDLPAGALQNVCYAVFGCGDSSYARFNAVAQRLDARLRQLGGQQLVPCGLGDEQAPAGVETALAPWLAALLNAIPAPGDGPGLSRDEVSGTRKSTTSLSLPPSFYRAEGWAHLEVSFAGGTAAAALTDDKDVTAMRSLVSSHECVLIAHGHPGSKMLCRRSKAAFCLLRAANTQVVSRGRRDGSFCLSYAYVDVTLDTTLSLPLLSKVLDEASVCKGGQRQEATVPCICVGGNPVVGMEELGELAAEMEQHASAPLQGEVAARILAALRSAGRAGGGGAGACEAKEIAMHEYMPAGAMGEDPAQHFWRRDAAEEGIRGMDSASRVNGVGVAGAALTRVKCVSKLTDTETWPDVRDVRHIELELPAAIEGHRQASCDYAAGDVAVVYARNRPVTTQRFLRLLRLDGDARVDALRVKAMGRGETGVEAAREFLVHQLNIQPPCALRELVSAQPDLERPPRPSMLRALAALASDPDHVQRLEQLADVAAEYREYIESSRRPLLAVLEDFPSVCSAGIGALLSVIPRLQPRPYSIASSPSRHMGEVHICVAMLRTVATKLAGRGVRLGICSSFLASLRPGCILPIRVSAAASSGSVGGGGLTFNYLRPAVLVGPGTGIAPMRAFLHERAARMAALRGRPDDVVSAHHQVLAFFGFRHRTGDFLYADELASLAASPGVSMHTAFSRDPHDGAIDGVKDYVQAHMEKEGRQVWEILRESGGGGAVYVAGAAGAMPRGVVETLRSVAQRHGGLSEQQALDWVQQLRSQHRLQIEAW